ncbi:hypothetical protein [Streptomyces sp. A10(2020)]|uniref:hypothetical protein n=1 Tax=Streptomyces sp. A10(2020) TaxID=2782013 RepID=UPI001F5C4B33|nr:hypothetical protein [Streptomyces sp. A10(2020)]
MEDAPETTDPRWLDPDEQQQWYAFATYVLDTSCRRPGGAGCSRTRVLAHFEYVALSALSTMAPSGPCGFLSELGAVRGSTLSRLSNVVIRLEKRGWCGATPIPPTVAPPWPPSPTRAWRKVTAAAPSPCRRGPPAWSSTR